MFWTPEGNAVSATQARVYSSERLSPDYRLQTTWRASTFISSVSSCQGCPCPRRRSTVPDMPTGQLIRLYRIDRKKSTTNVATLAGITVRYLEMTEAGTKTPTLHVL